MSEITVNLFKQEKKQLKLYSNQINNVKPVISAVSSVKETDSHIMKKTNTPSIFVIYLKEQKMHLSEGNS